MYKVTQTNKQGYIMSVSYQSASSVDDAISTAQMYHGYAGNWRAVKVS